MIKQIFLDTETTGPNHLKHGIYQIGGIIRYDNVFENFEFNCDIFEEDEIDPQAFELSSIRPEDLASFPDPFETYKKFVTLLAQHCDKYKKQDKFFFINAGAEFDSKFLRRWFESCGDQYFGSWFWHPPLDVFSLALDYLKDQRHKMENFKLITVAKQFGIKVDESKTHTALYDASLALQIYDLCCHPTAIQRANKNAQEIIDKGVYELEKSSYQPGRRRA